MKKKMLTLAYKELNILWEKGVVARPHKKKKLQCMKWLQIMCQ